MKDTKITDIAIPEIKELKELHEFTQTLSSGLYIAATPIGNLGDVSLRLLYLLKNCDYILCEDTRITAKLLQRYQIKKPLKVYNEQSAKKNREKILKDLISGNIIVLLSDAGTPLISDPGYKLTSLISKYNLTEANNLETSNLGAGNLEDRHSVSENCIYVTFLPGPCAAIAALILSNLPSDNFYFAGFLPRKSSRQKEILSNIKNLEASLIFYESPHRLVDTIASMVEIIGNRRAVIVREISKIHEETIRGKLSDLEKRLRNKPLKGEIVLVVEQPPTAENTGLLSDRLRKGVSSEDVVEKLFNKQISTRDIVDIISFITKDSKKDIYQMVNEIKAMSEKNGG